jgi:hypothetical protein
MKRTAIDQAFYSLTDGELAAGMLALYVCGPAHLFRELAAPLYLIDFILPTQ